MLAFIQKEGMPDWRKSEFRSPQVTPGYSESIGSTLLQLSQEAIFLRTPEPEVSGKRCCFLFPMLINAHLKGKAPDFLLSTPTPGSLSCLPLVLSISPERYWGKSCAFSSFIINDHFTIFSSFSNLTSNCCVVGTWGSNPIEREGSGYLIWSGICCIYCMSEVSLKRK